MNAPAIARNGTVHFQHAVAGHGDGQQIGRAGRAYLLRRRRDRQRLGELTVTAGFSDRDCAQSLPARHLDRGTGEVERQIVAVAG